MSFSKSAVGRMCLLLGLTALAICVQGYHLGADDAAIYVPGIKQAADPALYPFGAQFFHLHASLTLFPDLVGGSARLTRLPVDFIIFFSHAAGIFMLLLASLQLMEACFENQTARWSGVALLAVLLGTPVAGTALAIGDPYVTSRTLSTPAALFAVTCFLSGHRKQAVAWLVFTACMHPQMSVYALIFVGSLKFAQSRTPATEHEGAPAELVYLSALPFLFEFKPARGPARDVLFSRTYFFVTQWAWYEWIGAAAPLAFSAWLCSAKLRGTTSVFRNLARAIVPFGIAFTVAAIVLASSTYLENFTRLQPMRAFHLIYALFFLLLGGLAGEYVLRNKLWKWVGLFVPISVGMIVMQMVTYPASAHIEWPGTASGNSWADAFLWIRHNTPKNAVFALDPDYMLVSGEDMHGFRAIAERSTLADAVKDSGAVSLFPGLAEEWQSQVNSLRGWKHFHTADFEKLAGRYPVTWVVTQVPEPIGLNCPYTNKAVAVCRLENKIPAKAGL